MKVLCKNMKILCHCEEPFDRFRINSATPALRESKGGNLKGKNTEIAS
jgi:hypothetical protein